MIDKMKLINQYTRKDITEDEVFTFDIALCDNEVDKNFEAFDVAALNQMCKLFLGITGGVYEYRSDEERARIYDTWIETDPIKKTKYGDPFVRLKASAYIIKSEKNADLIKEIATGIKKDISVSCSAASKICSICGEKYRNNCYHEKGLYYKNNLCYSIITDINDAYEWWFVVSEDKEEKYKTYNGDENIVKISTRDCNGKWTTLEMNQFDVAVFLDDENCPMTEDDEIMMIFVNDVCIYSQLARGPIDWDQVNGFFA